MYLATVFSSQFHFVGSNEENVVVVPPRMWLEPRAAAITHQTHCCTSCTLLYRHLKGDTGGKRMDHFINLNPLNNFAFTVQLIY